jgi:translation initiation factor IF-2
MLQTGAGLQDLKDLLALQSELLDSRSDPAQPGEAMIIDSKVMKGSGIVLDCIVQWGTIKVGDIVVAGGEYGRIKALMVDGIAAGKKSKTHEEGALVDVQVALPGSPVRVLGLKGLPAAGEQLLVVDSEERAKAVIDGRQRKEKALELASVSAADAVKRAAERDAYNQRRQRKVAYETALQRERKRQGLRKAGIPIPPHLVMEPWESAIVQEGREGRIAGMDATGKKVRQQGGQQQDIKATHDTTLLKDSEGPAATATVLKMVPLLAKADSSASLAAVEDAVTRIVQASHEAYPKIVNSSVGELSEKDVQLAADMGANIVSFNAKIPQAVAKSAEKRKVQIRTSRVIYHLLDEICDLVAGQMTPVIKEENAAVAEVKALFNLNSKKADVSKVAGCVILEGTFSKSGMAKYNVVRDGEVVGSAVELASLMHLKDKVDSVKKGSECGMMLDGFAEVAVGDKIIAIKNISIKPKLEVRFD